MALEFHEVNDYLDFMKRPESPLPEGAPVIIEKAVQEITDNECRRREISVEEFQALPPHTVLDQSSEFIWKLALGEVVKLDPPSDAE